MLGNSQLTWNKTIDVYKLFYYYDMKQDQGLEKQDQGDSIRD